MNCSTCQENMNAFLSGFFPKEIKNSFLEHLEACDACKAVYSASIITDEVIKSEVAVQSNPYLSTRIMAEIAQQDKTLKLKVFSTVFKKMFQPAMVTLTLSTAVIFGIMVGKIYLNSDVKKTVPEELVYLDDASIESLRLLVTENNE